MRIKEEFKKLGYFSLPSTPREAVPGTLSISDGGFIELEIVHRLGGASTALEDDAKRIIGQIEEAGLVTLDNCFCKSIEGSGEISKSLFSVNRAFTGVGYDEDEIPRFNSVTFSVEGLDEWIGISGINVDYQLEEHTSTISYQPPEDVPFNLGDGMQLSVTFGWTAPGGYPIKEAGVSQKAYFELASQKALELDDFISVVRKITHFLCFAMDQTVSLDSMSATSNNLPSRCWGG